MFLQIPPLLHACLFICLCDYAHVQYVFVFARRPAADVWGDGDLPPGWREISDSSEVYFWHVPTGTTQYHRPVAPGNQQPDTVPDPHLEAQDSLKLPNEVRALTG